MTVTTQHNRISYTATAGQTVFPYTFMVLAATDLRVYIDTVLQVSGGYTVSNLGLGSGGNVTFLSPLVGGETVLLYRATEMTQQVDLLEGSKLPADPTEGMWDKLHLICQDLFERMARAVKVPRTSDAVPLGLPVNLPDPADPMNQDKALFINGSGKLEARAIASGDTISGPIIAPGDLIQGSLSGTPERLPIGAAGQVVTSTGTQAGWAPGLVNPMVALGDLLYGDVTGVPQRLPISFVDRVLRVSETGRPEWTPTSGHGIGQCRLILSGAMLTLIPYGGNKVWINGRLRGIAPSGVALAPTGLVADTTYYIYVYHDGTVEQLEASTTGYSATDGITHKTGDLSRTLVGLARPVAGPAWTDTAGQRFVLSWFNRRVRAAHGAFTDFRSTTSTVLAEIHPEIRTEFLAWKDATIQMSTSGSALGFTAGLGTFSSALALNGLTTSNRTLVLGLNAAISGLAVNIGDVFTKELVVDGYHYVTLYGAIDAPGTEAAWLPGTQVDVLIGG